MRRFAEIVLPHREKYIAVYLGKDGTIFKFVEGITHETQSIVQLVQDTATGELLVRKLPLFPSLGRHVKRIIAELNSSIGSCPSGILPFYEQLVKYGDRPDPRTPDIDISTTYWKFCNGGNLEWFLELYGNKNPIPGGIIARFLHHVLGTLHYIMKCLPEPVFHGDVLPVNIFLVWDQSTQLPHFYLGDWSRSVSYTEYRRYPGRGQYTRNGKYFWDLAGILEMLKTLICRGHAVSEFPVLVEKSPFRGIYRELQRMDTLYQEREHAEAMSSVASAVWLPDTLAHLIDIAKQLEQNAFPEYSHSEITRIRRIFRVADIAPTPKYYDTRAKLIEAMHSRMSFSHDPWYVACVNSGTGNILKVCENDPSPTL